MLEIVSQFSQKNILKLFIKAHNLSINFDTINLLFRLFHDFLRSEIGLFAATASPEQAFDIFFKALQIDRIFILFSFHRIQAVIAVSELHDLFPVAGPDGIVVHDGDILDKFDQSSLHVPRICSFDSGIDDPLSAAHGVEEKLCGCESGIEAVLYEASRFRGLEESGEVRKGTFGETVGDSFSTDCLLSHAADHLRQVYGVSLTAAKGHYEGLVVSIQMFDAIIADSLSHLRKSRIQKRLQGLSG